MNWHWPLAHHCHLARRLKPYKLVGIPLFHTAEDWCDRDIYRIGPTSDVIDDGVDGLLAKPDDPGDLAAKLLELLSDPGKRERTGQNGRTKTLKRYTWDLIIDKMEQLYRCVVDGHQEVQGQVINFSTDRILAGELTQPKATHKT